jgi:small subunit ribosomal protein S7
MARTGAKPKRIIAGDPVYNNTLIHKLINLFMQGGKKTLAQRIVYTAFNKCAEQMSISVPDLFSKVLENCRPTRVAVKRTVRGKLTTVPKDTDADQRNMYGLRNIVLATRSDIRTKGISAVTALTQIITDTCNGTGKAIELKKQSESAAEANKAYRLVSSGDKQKTI